MVAKTEMQKLRSEMKSLNLDWHKVEVVMTKELNRQIDAYCCAHKMTRKDFDKNVSMEPNENDFKAYIKKKKNSR